MLYKCIWPGCHQIWGQPEPGVSGYSHGLCFPHARLAFAYTFRRQQIREGNPDCYLRCFGYCHQPWCTFHPICTVDNPGSEQMAELTVRLEARRQSIDLDTGVIASLSSLRNLTTSIESWPAPLTSDDEPEEKRRLLAHTRTIEKRHSRIASYLPIPTVIISP